MDPIGILPLRGPQLRCAAMPLGGIGTGSIALGGDGLLKQWQVSNTVNHNAFAPNSFFGLHVKNIDVPQEKSIARALICPKVHAAKDFQPAASVNDHQLGAAIKQMFKTLPGVEGIDYDGEYPFAFLRFVDAQLPVIIKLRAFNPMIPLDPKNSGLPCLIFQFEISNPTDQRQEATLMGSLLNFLGWDGKKRFKGNKCPFFGGNSNAMLDIGTHWRGLQMVNRTIPVKDPRLGDLTLAVDDREAMVTEQWDDLATFWNAFSEAGVLPASKSADESPLDFTWAGSLAVQRTLAPGESTRVNFMIAWFFPNRVVDWRMGPEGDEMTDYWIGNQYTDWFAKINKLMKIAPKGSHKVVEYVEEHWNYLISKTEAFHHVFYTSTLPPELLVSIIAPTSTIRAPTCMWTHDGYFHGFEGCHGASTGQLSGGCCPMDCTHVWNYEFALAHLYPSLERTMRDAEFRRQTPEGVLPHRLVLPMYLQQFWEEEVSGGIAYMIGGPAWPALDGMFGMILKVYREYLISGDEAFLRKSWPFTERLIKYVWENWDEEGQGIIDGDQPNTYDISIFGVNTFMGTLYLAALRACEAMAALRGKQDLVEKCQVIFAQGSKKLDETCWNGEYYIQVYDASQFKEQQYGTGCHSDQLNGQWWAWNLGLGDLLPREHIIGAIKSIIKYNLREELYDVVQSPRKFAEDDEPSLLVCTWPKGGRPEKPTNYSDEIWTGIEYEVAALCLFVGLEADALKILRNVRLRYDGRRRSPWNEVECGDHYVRAMASWTLLRGYTGTWIDPITKTLHLARDFARNAGKVFISSGMGWGQLSCNPSSTGDIELMVEVHHGEIEVQGVQVHPETPEGLQVKLQVTKSKPA